MHLCPKLLNVTHRKINMDLKMDQTGRPFPLQPSGVQLPSVYLRAKMGCRVALSASFGQGVDLPELILACRFGPPVPGKQCSAGEELLFLHQKEQNHGGTLRKPHSNKDPAPQTPVPEPSDIAPTLGRRV